MNLLAELKTITKLKQPRTKHKTFTKPTVVSTHYFEVLNWPSKNTTLLQ